MLGILLCILLYQPFMIMLFKLPVMIKKRQG